MTESIERGLSSWLPKYFASWSGLMVLFCDSCEI